MKTRFNRSIHQTIFSFVKVRFSIVMATKRGIENESNELDGSDDSNESNHSHHSHNSRHSRQSSNNRHKRKLKDSSTKDSPRAKKPRHNPPKQRYHLTSQSDRLQTSGSSNKYRNHNKHKTKYRNRNEPSIATSPKMLPKYLNKRMFVWYPCTVYQ